MPGIAARETLPSFSWTGDGQLLISHGDHLVRQHTDGTNAVTLLSDPAAWISAPVSCDNDRWIALNWMVHGEGSANRIWRANPDGSGAVPLTSGEFGGLWGCSPDGKWLYYTEQITNGVLRVSAGGGKPELVPGANPPNSLTIQAALSPDGKTLAIFTTVLNPESKTYSDRIVLAGPDSGVRNLDLDPGLKAVFRSQGPPDSAGFRFSPDGKSIAFVIDEAGEDNIWMQPCRRIKGKKADSSSMILKRSRISAGPPTARLWPCFGLVLSPMSFSCATPETVRRLLRDPRFSASLAWIQRFPSRGQRWCPSRF